MDEDEYLERAWDFFRAKYPFECPVCNHDDWQIGKMLDPEVLGGDGVYYPFVPMSCKNCGYTYMLAADVPGLFSREEIENISEYGLGPSSLTDEEIELLQRDK